MKRIYIASFIAISVLIGCNGGEETLEMKQERLKNLQSQYEKIGEQINDLEKEIEKIDSTAIAPPEGKLITTMDVPVKDFEHYIEMQWTIQSKENITLTSDIGGRVEAIYVDEGEKVQKGELLIKIDDETIQTNIAEIQTSLDLAESLYQKQKRLWEQGIGSEVQYLEAKNRKEALEKRLQTTFAQLEKTRIKSPINGTVDKIFAKIGEMAAPGVPQVRVVNIDQVKVEAMASEAYVGTIQEGDSVIVTFPSLDEERRAVVTSVGQVIHPANRTFEVNVALDNKDNMLKPNLLAMIKIADYVKDSAVVIPTKYVQHSNRGEYVYTVNQQNGELVANKVPIETGRTYNGETEVVTGLKGGEELIAAGYREVIDGEQLRIKNN